jgi:cob(I)alamin adenosyltransferase
MMKLEKGLIQIYTGDGKGKTTAALGLAMRAVGRGLTVLMIQFMKGKNQTGELIMGQRLFPAFQIKPMGRQGLIGPEGPTEQDIALAKEGLDEAKKALSERHCDVLILDEINVAVSMKLLSEESVLHVLDRKPPDIELILTGRGAPEAFMERADLVTTMEPTKHYFDRGQQARIGIEF